MEKLKNNNSKMYKVPSSVLLIGDAMETQKKVADIISDLAVYSFDTLRILPEDSSGKENIISIKQIKEAQHFIGLTPNSQIKALIIERAELMNKEASNALLKMLEEPPLYAIIILTSRNAKLLPTIISRCSVISLKHNRDSGSIYDYGSIINSPFWQISALAEKISNSQQTSEFLNGIEKYLISQTSGSQRATNVKRIKEVIKIKQELNNNVSDRLIIESLILKFKYNV
ncbi:MAG: DNA polymerase III subunit delta' [bacterium ADurb.Bin212]|nr:MAG: DNA polymerase III subunit delta' [bacterium ADurb.Bin212]